MSFDMIAGHNLELNILRSMLRTGQVPHAFIFSGVEGIGKRTVAFAFIKALNCQEKQDDFCGVCLSCRKIEKLTHPDVVVIEPEKQVVTINQIRDMQHEIAYRPLEATKKAVIIDQAEKLNSHAANCLLKTLEEPPEDTVLILVAEGTAGMPSTVLSRCQHIRFSPLNDEDVLGLLAASGADTHRARQVVPYAGGSMKRAALLLESGFLDQRGRLAALLALNPEQSRDAALLLAVQIKDDSDAFVLTLEFLETWYRDMLLVQEGVTMQTLYNADLADSLQAAASFAGRETVIRKLKQISLVRTGRAFNTDVQLGLESLLL